MEKLWRKESEEEEEDRGGRPTGYRGQEGGNPVAAALRDVLKMKYLRGFKMGWWAIRQFLSRRQVERLKILVQRKCDEDRSFEFSREQPAETEKELTPNVCLN
ncbi:hypothetical protein RUM43_000273 [Polyplax serrata]|uniref:Uncharacterized protein n=1 Tax=Polyplax serrata TaxID=468196 RepID=A0AAN8SC52_POLSC